MKFRCVPVGEEGTKSLVNSQLFPGLPHLTGSKVTYCHVDRVKTVGLD